MAEFIEELDLLFMELDLRPCQQLSREEVAVVDVYGTIGNMEGNGLLNFWGHDDVDRILESFRIAGANEAADTIEATRWAVRVKEEGPSKEGYYLLSEEEDRLLSDAEDRVYELFNGLPTKLLEFARRNCISQK